MPTVDRMHFRAFTSKNRIEDAHKNIGQTKLLVCLPLIGTSITSIINKFSPEDIKSFVNNVTSFYKALEIVTTSGAVSTDPVTLHGHPDNIVILH